MDIDAAFVGECLVDGQGHSIPPFHDDTFENARPWHFAIGRPARATAGAATGGTHAKNLLIKPPQREGLLSPSPQEIVGIRRPKRL